MGWHMCIKTCAVSTRLFLVELRPGNEANGPGCIPVKDVYTSSEGEEYWYIIRSLPYHLPVCWVLVARSHWP